MLHSLLDLSFPFYVLQIRRQFESKQQDEGSKTTSYVLTDYSVQQIQILHCRILYETH